MKTVEYKLLSKPGETIKLPEGTLAHAKHFFSLAESAKNKRNVLIEMLDNDPYFTEMDQFLIEDILHANHQFNKYRLTKYKDTIYTLIGKFEVSNYYEQLETIEREINKTLSFLQENYNATRKR